MKMAVQKALLAALEIDPASVAAHGNVSAHTRSVAQVVAAPVPLVARGKESSDVLVIKYWMIGCVQLSCLSVVSSFRSPEWSLCCALVSCGPCQMMEDTDALLQRKYSVVWQNIESRDPYVSCPFALSCGVALYDSLDRSVQACRSCP
jgi:hypothetical protein